MALTIWKYIISLSTLGWLVPCLVQVVKLGNIRLPVDGSDSQFLPEARLTFWFWDQIETCAGYTSSLYCSTQKYNTGCQSDIACYNLSGPVQLHLKDVDSDICLSDIWMMYIDSDICLSDSHPTDSGVLLSFAVCLLTYYRHQSHSDLIPKWWSINVEVWMWWALCVWWEWEVYLIIESITTTFHTAIGHIKSTWTNITLARKV